MPRQLQLVVPVLMLGLLVAVIRVWAAMWVPAIVIKYATPLVTAVMT